MADIKPHAFVVTSVVFVEAAFDTCQDFNKYAREIYMSYTCAK